jgi:uncharacterized protein
MEAMMKSAITWFEIPVQDMPRAVAFYEAMLDTTLKQELFGGIPNAIFPSDREGVGGALVLDPRLTPNNHSTILYLNATGKLDECISRAREAGGVITMPKTHIGDPGFIALLQDTEGNCVGLHSPM